MKPTKHEIELFYKYQNGRLVFSRDSGRHGKYKAGSLAGSLNSQGIRMIFLNGKYHQEHQLIWAMHHGSWPERVLRHINGDLSDNRIENLMMDSAARGKRKGQVTADRIKEVLSYNPETGEFFWKISPRNRTLPGDRAGYVNDNGYMLCTIDQQIVRLHRAAWAIFYGELPKKHIDHINGVRSDNRIANLREVTHSENNQNSALRKTSKTNIKGVHFRNDTGKYSASITLDKKTHWLGCFDTLEEAKQVRLEAEAKFHPFNAASRIYQ